MALGAIEVVLVWLVGPPSGPVRVLVGLLDPSADAVGGIIAALALTCQAMTAYLAVVLTLRVLEGLPGMVGWLAVRAGCSITAPGLRRLLDSLLGGVLLAQLVLGPIAARSSQAHPLAAAVAVASTTWDLASHRQDGELDRGLDRAAGRESGGASSDATARPSERLDVRPPPPVPLPAWLGGRPPTTSTPAAPRARQDRYTIAPSDTLWGIAAARLAPGSRTNAAVAAYWPDIYQRNRGVLGPDPDLIQPATVISLPPYRPASRP